MPNTHFGWHGGIESFTYTPLQNKYIIAHGTVRCLLYYRVLQQMSRNGLFALDMILEILKHLIPCESIGLSMKMAHVIKKYLENKLCLGKRYYLGKILAVFN